jgi:peptide/nickel transport system permease protein
MAVFEVDKEIEGTAVRGTIREVGIDKLRRSSRWAIHNPVGATSLFFITIVMFSAVFAPLVAPYDPKALLGEGAFLSPRVGHWLGTDQLGRDVFSRVVYGARPAMAIGVGVALAGSIIGGAVGVVGGYVGGTVDLLGQRFVDALSGFPALILALVFVAILGQSEVNVFLALLIVSLPRVIRTERSVVLSVKEMMYIDAARSIGMPPWRIMLLHILPNCMVPIIILASMTVGWAIIISASLSFLGVGVPPDIPTWGNMLGSDAQQYYSRAPWLAVAPGMAIMLTVLAFNLFGDTLRDKLDPRLRGT